MLRRRVPEEIVHVQVEERAVMVFATVRPVGSAWIVELEF